MAGMKKKPVDADMRKEYDFSGGVRGKYAKHFADESKSDNNKQVKQPPTGASPRAPKR